MKKPIKDYIKTVTKTNNINGRVTVSSELLIGFTTNFSKEIYKSTRANVEEFLTGKILDVLYGDLDTIKEKIYDLKNRLPPYDNWDLCNETLDLISEKKRGESIG